MKFLANHYLPLSVFDCQVFDSGASVEVLVGGLSGGRRSLLRLLHLQVLRFLLLSDWLRLRLLLDGTSFLYDWLWLGRRDDLSLGSSRLRLIVQRIGHVDFTIRFWLLIMRGFRRLLIFLVIREDDDLAGLFLGLPASQHCFPLFLEGCLCSCYDAGLRDELV